MENLKIGFLGLGNMGSALAEGMTKVYCEKGDKNTIKKENIFFYRRTPITNEFTILESNAEVVKKCDVIICAVKPDVALTVLPSIKDYLNGKILISICAGINLRKLEECVGEMQKVVRLLPNTPSFVGEGATSFCVNSHVTDEDKKLVVDIFSKCGLIEEVKETYMDILTGLAGSGPGYVFLFLESLIDAGVKNGLPRELAKKFALKTVKGSVKMAEESNLPIQQLKDNVCSPGGTTIRGLFTLEKNRFKYAIIAGVDAACEQSKCLGEILNK